MISRHQETYIKPRAVIIIRRFSITRARWRFNSPHFENSTRPRVLILGVVLGSHGTLHPHATNAPLKQRIYFIGNAGTGVLTELMTHKHDRHTQMHIRTNDCTITTSIKPTKQKQKQKSSGDGERTLPRRYGKPRIITILSLVSVVIVRDGSAGGEAMTWKFDAAIMANTTMLDNRRLDRT